MPFRFSNLTIFYRCVSEFSTMLRCRHGYECSHVTFILTFVYCILSKPQWEADSPLYCSQFHLKTFKVIMLSPIVMFLWWLEYDVSRHAFDEKSFCTSLYVLWQCRSALEVTLSSISAVMPVQDNGKHLRRCKTSGLELIIRFCSHSLWKPKQSMLLNSHWDPIWSFLIASSMYKS